MKGIWRGWKRFAHKLISAQNWLLMALVYWFAVMPVAVFLKLIGHKLINTPAKDDSVDSYWEPRDDGGMDMGRAQRMF